MEFRLIQHSLTLPEVRGLLKRLENVSNFSFSAQLLSKCLWLDSYKVTDTDGCSCNASCWQCGCLTLDGFISKHYGLHQWLITIILITMSHLCSRLTSCKWFAVQLAPECPLRYHVIISRWAAFISSHCFIRPAQRKDLDVNIKLCHLVGSEICTVNRSQNTHYLQMHDDKQRGLN